jgi:hypothetical protein
MRTIIHNSDVIAIPSREVDETGSRAVEVFESFSTEYGLFIPVTTSGYHFNRWLRRGMKDVLPKDSISAYGLHISNDGEVFTMCLDTAENQIALCPVTSKEFSLLTINRDKNEAFTYLLKDCTTIADAVKLVDDSYPDGIYNPHILLVSDWVEYSKKKGYDKIFYHTRFFS